MRIKGFRSAARVLLVALTLASATASAAPREATLEEVLRLSERFPVLDIAKDDCPPFIARGSMPAPEDDFEYEVVWLGKGRPRMAFFDPADGLPFVVTGGRGLLLYDLLGPHVHLAGIGDTAFSVVPSGDGLGGLSTLRQTVPTPGSDAPVRFDIVDAMLEAADRSTIDRRDDGSVCLTQRIDANRTRVMVFPPPPSRNVSFGQVSARSGKYTSYHELILDGVDPNDPALQPPQFGDVAIRLNEDPQPPELLPMEDRFHLTMSIARMRAAAGGDAAQQAALARLELDWAEVRKRDADRREAWLKRLRDLNVTLAPPAERPWDDAPRQPLVRRADDATTRPATAAP